MVDLMRSSGETAAMTAGRKADRRCGAASGPAVTLALGPERGWSASERNLLRAQDFTLVHLGPRVLRVETAAVAGVTLARSARGWLR